MHEIIIYFIYISYHRKLRTNPANDYLGDKVFVKAVQYKIKNTIL